MLDLFNTPTPQQSNYQEFYGGGTTRDWVKPRGASMVRIMLIGAGGGGGNGSSTVGGGGGGSGAITSWIGPAMFVPDVLRITVGTGGTSGVNATASSVIYQAKDGTGYTLLTADRSALYVWTGGAGTLTLTSAITLGNNWFMQIRNGGSGALTITPSGGQLIDGGANLILATSEACFICCSGTAFYTIGLG